MKRSAMLYEVTHVMGEALAQLTAEGVELDERSTRLWADRIIDIYRALPDPPAAALADSVNDDEVNHGGLVSRKSLHLANVARRKAPVDLDIT